jgi:hypothetical protein
LVVLAFQAEAEQVRKGELKDKSFTAGPLKSEPSARWPNVALGYRRAESSRSTSSGRFLTHEDC